MKISNLTLLLLLAFVLGACTTPGALDSSAGEKMNEAVQSENLSALKELLATVPAAPKERAETDQKLVNQALQMTIAKGASCNMEMANYLYDFGGLADYIHMPQGEISGFRADYQKWKMPLCGNFVIDSQRKHLSRKVSVLLTSQVYERQQNESKESFVKRSYNDLIGFLNNVDYKNSGDLSYGIQKFAVIAAQAIDYGKEGCSKDSSGEICLAYGNYQKLPDDIINKKEFPKKSDAYKQLKSFSDSLRLSTK